MASNCPIATSILVQGYMNKLSTYMDGVSSLAAADR